MDGFCDIIHLRKEKSFSKEERARQEVDFVDMVNRIYGVSEIEVEGFLIDTLPVYGL